MLKLLQNHFKKLTIFSKVVHIGISAAGLYVSTGQSFEYQERVFSKLSLGILPILFVTPENELDGEQRKMTIRNWKTGIIQIMIVTNGFGMGINVPDQILYKKLDEQDVTVNPQKVFLPQENNSEILAKRLRHYEDISNEACGLCDNCLLNSNNNPVWNNFSADVVRLLKIAKEILESRKISEMIPLDIAAVFCKLKRANKLGLSELSIYNEPFERKIKNKENVLFVIDDLHVKDFLF
ncbi:hypothetical protein C1646_773937 [Rhizophagus diaphanus]|nr:hypothetical protein C1646_773937 [Rhizophagus diaphanus] [Rhizophagus sp. MUCL 43196]